MKTVLVLLGVLSGGGVFALGIHTLLREVSFRGRRVADWAGTDDRPASPPTDAPGREEV